MFRVSDTLLSIAVTAIFGAAPSFSQGHEGLPQSSALRETESIGPEVQTLSLDAQVLMKIHRALMHESMSPGQAAEIERTVLKIGEWQSKYRSDKADARSTYLEEEEVSYLKNLNYYLESLPNSSTALGTICLQDQILNKIDSALKNGSITAERATRLETKINGICSEEAWHFVTTESIPSELVSRNKSDLNAMQHDLDTKLAENHQLKM